MLIFHKFFIMYILFIYLHISFIVVSLTLYLHFSTGDSPEMYLAKETDIAARQKGRELSYLPMQIPELGLKACCL